MRIRVLRHLHCEFSHVPLPAVAGDVVVLAGDSDLGSKGVVWAHQAVSDTPFRTAADPRGHYVKQMIG